MMAAVGARWVCLLCKERALEDPMAKERAKYRMSSYVPNYTWWIIGLTILGWLTHLGVGLFFESAKTTTRNKLIPQPIAQEAAPWAAKPPTEWPKLVTEAAGTMKTPLFVASNQACFVENDEGTLLALTTVGLKTDVGEKDGDIDPARLNSEIGEWSIGSGEQALKFTKIRDGGEDAFVAGLVILPAPEGAKAPISTVTLRKNNYRPGAPAFAVTRTADGNQRVYRGSILDNDSADGSIEITSLTLGRSRTIYTNGDGSATRVHFDEAIKVGDLLGAALVDSDGLLMAVITSPQAEVGRDAKTKTFMAFGMKALREAINFRPAAKRPLERGKK